MIKVGINGFGRIGSLAFRAAIKSDDIEVVAINAPGHPASHIAYCVKYDSVHGRFDGEVVGNDEDSTVTVNGKVVKVLSDKTYRDASLIPWGELGVEYVLECTGVYLEKSKAQAHIDAGAKVVVMSGPAKDDTPMFVCGVNLDKYTPDMQFVSNASCTTNCLAPITKVVNDNFGIIEGLMTTVHASTATQAIVDGFPKKGSARRPFHLQQHHPLLHRRCQGRRQGHPRAQRQAHRYVHAYPGSGRVRRRRDLPS